MLQETRRLREENDVLRIQVSSSGPSRDQQSRSQRTNSRHNQEVTYPRTIEPLPNVHRVWPGEGPLPTCCTPQDESSDSTRISSKRQCNRKSQLSDAMCARLGLQAPGKDKPLTTTAQEAYLSPSVAPITQNCPPHQPLQ